MKKEGSIYKKSFYCCDLPGCGDGVEIFDLFLLAKMDYSSNERAVKWFNVLLSDRSGDMKAKIWSDKMNMEYEGYVGHVVLVRGRVNYYGGRPEISVKEMKLMEEGTYDLSEICRVISTQRYEGCIRKITELTEKISTSSLKRFVKDILDDGTLEQMGRLPVHRHHHAYRGALLEHTCEVAFSAYCLACSASSVHMVKCHMDLVIAGALLHDISSLYQYKADGYDFVEENKSRLIGRSGIVLALLNEKKGASGLDEELCNLLIHVINSSHEGSMEPMTMEAMIVRSANRLSAELESYENTRISNQVIYAGNDDFIWSKDLKRMIYVGGDSLWSGFKTKER